MYTCASDAPENQYFDKHTFLPVLPLFPTPLPLSFPLSLYFSHEPAPSLQFLYSYTTSSNPFLCCPLILYRFLLFFLRSKSITDIFPYFLGFLVTNVFFFFLFRYNNWKITNTHIQGENKRSEETSASRRQLLRDNKCSEETSPLRKQVLQGNKCCGITSAPGKQVLREALGTLRGTCYNIRRIN